MTKSKSVLFEGGVEKISTLADGSLRIHIGTPELSNETMVNLFQLNRKTGYVLLSPYPVNEDQKNAVEKAAEVVEHESTEFGKKLLVKDYELYCMLTGNNHNLNKLILIQVI